MLEVLVSIVVLSFGVLGVVGLQAASLQANKDARYQSSAVRLGRELGDMMRGNKQVAVATTAAANPYLRDFTSANLPAKTQDCFVNACTTDLALAQFQMEDWGLRVAAELPGFRAVVCFDASPYTAAGGLPEWDCSDSGGLAVVKLGWTRGSTNRAAAAASALEFATTPTVVLPLIAGSVE